MAIEIEFGPREREDTDPMSAAEFRRYYAMRRDGQEHRFAVMMATRSFPGVKTDSVFNEGKFSGKAGRVDRQQVWMIEQAERAGVSVTGKWYNSGLARYPGDPRAWIDGMDDVRRIAAEDNLTVHGYVEHQGREVEPMPDIEIDPRLVKAEADAVHAAMPGSRYGDVYEHVHNLRTGKIDNEPLHVTGSSDLVE